VRNDILETEYQDLIGVLKDAYRLIDEGAEIRAKLLIGRALDRSATMLVAEMMMPDR
jgi:hypothetical protein